MSNQKDLLDFVDNPDNLNRAIEGSMEKRQAIIDQANTLTIEQRLDELIPCINCGSQADNADGFGSCTCGNERRRQSILQLLNKARIEAYKHGLMTGSLPEALGKPIAKDYLAQLTPQEQ